MLFKTRDEMRISLIGGAILLILTVASGVSVYAVMRQQAEAYLSHSVQLNLESRTQIVEREISQNMANSVALASRTLLQEPLETKRARPQDASEERGLDAKV